MIAKVTQNRTKNLAIFQKMAGRASAGMEVLSIVQSHVRQVLCSLQHQLDSLPVSASQPQHSFL